jgi:DNA-directed RNA polymerase I, II, and III subunit RPABC2
MNGLEEVSIDDLLNNSGHDKDSESTFIYKKSSSKPEEIDNSDEDEDEIGLNVNEDEEDDEDIIEDDEDEDVDAEQYENGPKFKETDTSANTNYTLPSFIAGGENDLELQAEDDDDDDDDDEDTNYLQKFDTDLRENFIEKHHPEAKNHNFEEVKHMSRVVRNETGIIIDNLHKTLPFLTKYETARILGQRAKQLNSGAKSFVKIPPNVIDGYEIAKLELEEKKIPFIIKRPIPDGTCEYWNVSDLEVL